MPIHYYGNAIYGVDYSIPPHLLPQGFLADGRNVVVNSSGLITGRKGSVKLNSTSLASRITSVFEYLSGTTRYTLNTYGENVGLYSSGTGEFTAEITGLTSGKMWQWINFGNKAIGVNEGYDTPQYFTDASTHGDLTGAPKGLCIAEWGQRVWFGGDSTNNAKLTGSALNDPTDYTTSGDAGYVEIYIGDDKDPITGIFGFFDMLLVGKKNAMYKVTGDPTTTASELAVYPVYTKDADSTGFTSPWAITQVGNDVIYLDGYDIKRLSGIQEYGDVETVSIIPHFKDYLKSVVDRDYLKYAHFFHYKQAQQIWCSIPTGATTHFVFVLDYKFKETTGRYSFFPMYNLAVNCFGGIEDGSVMNLYYGDETGYVHQLDIGENDNGSAISRYFVTVVSGNKTTTDESTSVYNGHEHRKQYHKSETHIYSQESALSMTPSYAIDLMNDAQVRTSSNYTDLTAETVTGWTGTGIKRKRLRFWGLSGKTMALKWTHSAVAQNFIFYPSEVHYTWKSANEIV